MIRLICFLVIWFYALSHAAGQQPLLKHYWLNERRLAIKTNDIAQDTLGYLWLATDEGLFRYNGLEFIKIGGEKRQRVTAVVYFDQKIIVGLENGVLQYVKGVALVPYSCKNYLPGYDILNFNKKGQDELWLSTEAGTWQLRHHTAIHFTVASGLTDQYTYDTDFWGKDQALIGCDKGLNMLRLRDKPIVERSLSIQDGLGDNIVRTVAMQGNRIWIGTQTGGVQLYDLVAKKMWPCTVNTPWAWGAVTDIETIDRHRAVAATTSGVVLMLSANEDKKHITLRPYAILAAPVNEIFLDKTGNVWCGTDNGLSLILSERISHITLPKPYDIKQLTAICNDGRGNLWLAQDNRLYRYHQATGIMKPVLRLPGKITCLYNGTEGRLWIGTINHGVFYRDEAADIARSPVVTSLADATVLSILEHNGAIWLAGLNGIDILAAADVPGGYTHKSHFSKRDGAGSDYIYALYKDRADNVWVASDGGGVRMYKDKQFRQWPQLNLKPQQVAYAVTQDNRGNIWFADLDYQLNKLENGQWTRYNDAQPEHNGELSILTANSNGYIIRCFPSHVDFFSERHKTSWQFEIGSWLEKDSFTSALNCYTKDPEGNIYLPLTSGLLLVKDINPAALAGQNVIIQKITNNGNEINAQQNRFGASQNYFAFQFDAIFFTDARKFYYRYKLSGNNEDWIYTNANYASFSNLPPGSYRFIVQAAPEEHFLNFAEQSYIFYISKPFWTQWWFSASLLLALAAGIYFYNTRRVRQLHKRAAAERQHMYFQYEYLRSQINPHFLFNSLNTLAAFIEEEPAKAVTYTEQLSDLYRNTVTHLDRNLITLEDELAILENYIRLQQYRFDEALQVSIDIEASRRASIMVVPMALQFLVENALKHNIVSKTAPLVVCIELEEDYIVVRNKINRKQQVVRESRLGLQNIKQRYAQYTAKPMRQTEDKGYWIVALPIVLSNEH